MKKKAKVLSEFTDVLNAHGAQSTELQRFRAQHRDDAELQKLFDTTIEVQKFLRGGVNKIIPLRGKIQ